MKNYELFEIKQGLDKITNLETSLPVSEAFKIIKNKKLIEKELEAFEEVKNSIVSRYADENGEVKKENPNFDKCYREVMELGNQSCDEINFRKIKLASIEKLELPMNLITSIEFMIDDNDEDKNGKWGVKTYDSES